jgi:hypothetical protein
MKKKPYQAPVVRKVHLEIKNAVLGNCHSSTNMDPATGPGCTLVTGCWAPPSS